MDPARYSSRPVERQTSNLEHSRMPGWISHETELTQYLLFSEVCASSQRDRDQQTAQE